VEFHTDGSPEIDTSCNKMFGAGEGERKSISITLMPSARMAGPSNSQEQKFLKDLEGLFSFFLKVFSILTSNLILVL
jgi:heat shock protein HslJ